MPTSENRENFSNKSEIESLMTPKKKTSVLAEKARCEDNTVDFPILLFSHFFLFLWVQMTYLYIKQKYCADLCKENARCYCIWHLAMAFYSDAELRNYNCGTNEFLDEIKYSTLKLIFAKSEVLLQDGIRNFLPATDIVQTVL